MLISDNKKNDIAKQAGVLRTKLPVIKRQHLQVVNVSVAVVIAQANAHHPPPPKKKKKKLAKLPFCFI